MKSNNLYLCIKSLASIDKNERIRNQHVENFSNQFIAIPNYQSVTVSCSEVTFSSIYFYFSFYSSWSSQSGMDSVYSISLLVKPVLIFIVNGWSS